MKFALFGDYQPGLVVDDHIVDLSDVAGSAVMSTRPFARLTALIAHFETLRPAIEQAASAGGHALGEAHLRAPIPRAGKVLVATDNHQEFANDVAKRANLYVKMPTSVADPSASIPLPPSDAVTFHHEAHVVAVIGKAGRDIPQDEAASHIFGYTGAINIIARGLGFGTGIDSDGSDATTPLGPWIVTADEIDSAPLSVRLRVNGIGREEYSTLRMHHSFAELVAFASRFTRLEPGDLIFGGANYQGIGPVQDGDVLTMTIDKIGTLAATVSDPRRRRWPRGIDAGLAYAVRHARLSGGPVMFKNASVAQLGDAQ